MPGEGRGDMHRSPTGGQTSIGGTSGGSPPRSQPTRDRILAAAREVFAREGYELATIRSIAAEARIHPSMVMRYHGTKQDLFAAAAAFDLRLPALTEVERAGLGQTLVSHFLSRWEGATEDGQLQVLLRAAVSNDVARARLASIFEEQLVGAISRIETIDRADVRAALVASQMLGLAFGRYVARLPGVVQLEPDVIIACVGRTVQDYLTRPLPTEICSRG